MNKTPIGRVTFGGRDLASYRVVIAAGAPDHVREAAEELSASLERAAGIRLPIVPDDTPAEAREIVLGVANRGLPALEEKRAELKNDGVLFFALGERLFLQSESEIGVKYAVYKFLERQLGFRYLDEDTELIDPADTVDIPGDLCYSHSSPLVYRHTDWRVPTVLRRKWCLNGEDGTRNRIIGFCHTMQALAGVPEPNQPCLTDENVYQTVLKNVRRWIDENPGCRIVSVTQNDNRNYCKCPRCEALAAKENQSGIMLTFVNRLADEIKEEHPEVRLLTFAYQYTRKPPVTIRPRDNVIIWLCSIECCYSHTLNDQSCERNTAFFADFRAWASISKNVFIWDYTTNYSRYCSPFPNFFTLLPNARFYVENSAVALFEEGGHQQRENGEFRSLRAYLTGKVLWDPYMSKETYDGHIRSFLQGYYGEGWEYIYEYVLRTCEKAKKMHLYIYVDPATVFLTDDGKPDLPFCLEMKALWDKAEQAAKDERSLAHVRASRCQIDLMVTVVRSVQSGAPDPEANRALVEEIRAAGVVYHREGWGNPFVFVESLNESVINALIPNDWAFLGDPSFRASHGITDPQK